MRVTISRSIRGYLSKSVAFVSVGCAAVYVFLTDRMNERLRSVSTVGRSCEFGSLRSLESVSTLLIKALGL